MRESGTSLPVEKSEAQRERNAQRDGRRTLTAEALENLLALLDADRDRAGVLYEALRRRLQGLLRWWGSGSPLELADRTLDRVAMKLLEGAPVSAEALPGYVRGVARFVFHESLRERRHEEDMLRDLPVPSAESVREHALGALDVCLETLGLPDRGLILGYYAARESSMIEARRRLASELRLSPTALRIRAHRLRQRLEECLAAWRDGNAR